MLSCMCCWQRETQSFKLHIDHIWLNEENYYQQIQTKKYVLKKFNYLSLGGHRECINLKWARAINVTLRLPLLSIDLLIWGGGVDNSTIRQVRWYMEKLRNAPSLT